MGADAGAGTSVLTGLGDWDASDDEDEAAAGPGSEAAGAEVAAGAIEESGADGLEDEEDEEWEEEEEDEVEGEAEAETGDSAGREREGGAGTSGAGSARGDRQATSRRSGEPLQLRDDNPMYLPVLTDADLEADPPGHRSGYVAVIGKPNAGKSTLINALVGQKLSPVTHKPQTTRHRIVGIASDAAYQMILFDTPGIIAHQRSALDERMMAAVVGSIKAAEAIVAVVDAADDPHDALAMFQPGPDWNGPPMAVLLNKSDLVGAEKLEEVTEWYRTNCRAEQVFVGSALAGDGGADGAVSALKAWAVSRLPEGPTLYPKEMASEQPEKFFVAELVREQIFLQYDQEIPYSTQVHITQFKERRGAKDFVSATVFVERDSQKGIMVGAGGAALKRLGREARASIEDFLGRPVYLELTVQVAPGWRTKTESLREYGYYDPLLM